MTTYNYADNNGLPSYEGMLHKALDGNLYPSLEEACRIDKSYRDTNELGNKEDEITVKRIIEKLSKPVDLGTFKSFFYIFKFLCYEKFNSSETISALASALCSCTVIGTSTPEKDNIDNYKDAILARLLASEDNSELCETSPRV